MNLKKESWSRRERTHLEGSNINTELSPFLPISNPTTVLLCPWCCKNKGCLLVILIAMPFDSIKTSKALIGWFKVEVEEEGNGRFEELGEDESEEGEGPSK